MRRHALTTRLWHWLSLPCVVVLFMSGLNISNAHPWLYWGHWGFAPEQAWATLPNFPPWMTVPGRYSLAQARAWHVLAAWPFALLLLFAWAAMLANRHFARDIATTRTDWKPRAVLADVRAHLRLDFDHEGHARGRYNFLQRLSYGLVLGVLLPGMVLTGIAISPGMGPGFGWIAELLGGRQTARTIHFAAMVLLVGFFIIHMLMILAAGPVNELRSIVTGWYRADPPQGDGCLAQYELLTDIAGVRTVLDDLFQNLFSFQYAVFILGQEKEQIEFFPGKNNWESIDCDRPRQDIDLQFILKDDIAAAKISPSDYRINSRGQFRQMERFG